MECSSLPNSVYRWMLRIRIAKSPSFRQNFVQTIQLEWMCTKFLTVDIKLALKLNNRSFCHRASATKQEIHKLFQVTRRHKLSYHKKHKENHSLQFMIVIQAILISHYLKNDKRVTNLLWKPTPCECFLQLKCSSEWYQTFQHVYHQLAVDHLWAWSATNLGALCIRREAKIEIGVVSSASEATRIRTTGTWEVRRSLHAQWMVWF